MRKLEMKTWSIFDHNEEALAKWAFYHDVQSSGLEDINSCIIKDIEKILDCVKDFFKPAGPIQISYQIKTTNTSDRISNQQTVGDLETVEHPSDWTNNELKRFMEKYITHKGGLHLVCINSLEICGKIKIQKNKKKPILYTYPKRILSFDDAPIVILIEPVNQKDPGNQTPDSIMIIIEFWTDIFMRCTNAISGEIDNSYLANINNNRLSNMLVSIERRLDAEIKWWEGWHSEYMEKYGFKQETHLE